MRRKGGRVKKKFLKLNSISVIFLILLIIVGFSTCNSNTSEWGFSAFEQRMTEFASRFN